MKEVAILEIKDRTELFQATAISMGMQPNVIEKDFWVCFMLDHLFHDCRYKRKIGKTTLLSIRYIKRLLDRRIILPILQVMGYLHLVLF